MAESENTRHKQQVEHLQRQLTEVQRQLSEVNDAAKLHSETDAKHAELLKKVGRNFNDQRHFSSIVCFGPPTGVRLGRRRSMYMYSMMMTCVE